jgi:hypothetical protein
MAARLCAAVAELPDRDAEPLGFVGQVVLDAGTTPGLPMFSQS